MNSTKLTEERKASMREYNNSITDTKKIQYRQKKIIQMALTGKTKSIRVSTLAMYKWTDEEIAIITPFIKEKTVYITPVIKKEIIDFETLLTCEKIKEHMSGRKTSHARTVNLISATRTLANACIGNWNSDPAPTKRQRETDGQKRPNLRKTYTADNQDFRKVLDLTPSEILDKLNQRIYKGVITPYANGSIVQYFATIGNVINENEYQPAIDYVKTKHNYGEYITSLNLMIHNLNIEIQSKRTETPNMNTTIEKVYNDFEKLFENEKSLRKTRNDNFEKNQEYISLLIYTLGMFKGEIHQNNVEFVPRLIHSISLKKPKDINGGMWYNSLTGVLHSSGSLGHKTGGLYEYNHMFNRFVTSMLNDSLDKFPTLPNGDERTKLIHDESDIINKMFHHQFGGTNTSYRKLMDTVFLFIDNSPKTKIRMSGALAHSIDTSRLIYQFTIDDKKDVLKWINVFKKYIKKLDTEIKKLI
tara:strand:+ start:94 stop:1512 length:1419 start_codon:yes stop_codon:yes gene_type:complete